MMLTSFIAGARVGGGDGYHLIASLAQERGVAMSATTGQLRLAEVLVRKTNVAEVLLGALSEDAIIRILTGEVSPGDAQTTIIGAATDGVVRPEMFGQPAEATPRAGEASSGGHRSHVPAGHAAELSARSAELPVIASGRGHALISFTDVQVRVPKAAIPALIRGLQKAEARLA